MTLKQKTLHPASPFWSCARLFAVVCVSGIAQRPAIAQTPAGFEASSLKMLAAPSLKDGTYVAGIDISMAAGSHTYWKQPGDAGVPPVFSFNGSENVAKADVLFPAPSRISADGLESFGYENHVVFPIRVKPANAGKPAVLHVDVAYAVCNKICIPAHGDAMLKLDPQGGGADATLVDSALMKVPHSVSPAEKADLAIAPDKGATKPTWTLTWTGANPLDDIFADAPEGFYFDTRKRGKGSWSLVASQSLAQPKGVTVPVALILTRKGGANLVVTEKLDVNAPTQ